MKIDQEKFNKLKQLDRIEYRQKVEIIKNWKSGSWGTTFLFLFAGIIAFTIILVPQGYSAFGIEFVADIIIATKMFLSFLLPLIFFGYAADLVFHTIRKNNLKMLEEEYFSIEVKK